MKVVKKKKPSGVPPDKYCNGKRSNGQLCRKTAGAGTTHPGQGRCRRHDRGGPKQLKSGFYSTIHHHTVQDTLVRLSTVEANILDLSGEANLLRALTIDYINRYKEFQDALMAWYQDSETKMRPRRIMDISDAASLVESISRVVQRMHQIQSEGSISLDTFRRVTEAMGVSVAKHLKGVPDASLIINRIEAEWMRLAVDAKAPPTSADPEPESDS